MVYIPCIFLYGKMHRKFAHIEWHTSKNVYWHHRWHHFCNVLISILLKIGAPENVQNTIKWKKTHHLKQFRSSLSPFWSPCVVGAQRISPAFFFLGPTSNFAENARINAVPVDFASDIEPFAHFCTILIYPGRGILANSPVLWNGGKFPKI